MSCCSGCQQGRGCDGLGNVSIVGGRVVPGTVISWGGQIVWPGTNESIGWHSDAEAKIKNNLWAHGGFSQVDAGQIAGFWNPYISIRVKTKVEFAYLGDVYNTIEGAIWNAGFAPKVENFQVDRVPSGTPNTPQITQPGRAGGVYKSPEELAKESQSVFDPCRYINIPYLCSDPDPGAPSDKNFLDELADWLGVGQTEAALIGVGLGIGAVVLVKRLL